MAEILTKRAWVELIQTTLAGGAVTSDLLSKYHPLVIEKLFSVVYNGLLYQVHANAVTYKDWSQLDPYCKPYKNVKVLKDEDRNEYYSILPASIIELPANRGIRLISPMKDQKNKFRYSDNNSVDVWDELEAQNVLNYVSFYRENDKIFYRNFDEDYLSPGLLFKLIVPLSEFGDNDALGIPAQRSLEIFAMMKELFQKNPPEDVAADNNSKQI